MNRIYSKVLKQRGNRERYSDSGRKNDIDSTLIFLTFTRQHCTLYSPFEQANARLRHISRPASGSNTTYESVILLTHKEGFSSSTAGR